MPIYLESLKIILVDFNSITFGVKSRIISSGV